MDPYTSAGITTQIVAQKGKKNRILSISHTNLITNSNFPGFWKAAQRNIFLAFLLHGVSGGQRTISVFYTPIFIAVNSVTIQ